MRLSDIIRNMRAEQRRQLAGQIVRDEVGRDSSMTLRKCAQLSGMAMSSLYRVLTGEITKDSAKLRALENVLDLPDSLLTFVITGDVRRITAIGDTNIRSALRDRILNELKMIEEETVVDDNSSHEAQ